MRVNELFAIPTKQTEFRENLRCFHLKMGSAGHTFTAYMDDGLARREIEAMEKLIAKNLQQLECMRDSIESMKNFEDDAEYEKSGWVGWNG